MGFLYYGNSSYSVEIDDRSLAHLKIVILSLLRAGKGVAFSFDRSSDIGSGRETLWISPSTEIRFRFNGGRPPRINQLWLQDILATSDAPTGLRLVTEPLEAIENASTGNNKVRGPRHEGHRPRSPVQGS